MEAMHSKVCSFFFVENHALLKDLNLLDRFLFNEVVEDSENIKTILDIILEQDTKLKNSPQTEKEIRTLPDNRKHSSMVFQSYNLFKNKTALENVMEALVVVQKKPKAEAEKVALGLLEKVGMLERKDFYPSKLSGGQQQGPLP